MTTQQEIEKLETELKLLSSLGRAYFSDEAREMKKRLWELRGNEIKSLS